MSSYLPSGEEGGRGRRRALMTTRTPLSPRFPSPLPPIADVGSIQRSIANHVEYTLASSRFNFDAFKAYIATAHRCVGRAREW
jgi:hypothetical protein